MLGIIAMVIIIATMATGVGFSGLFLLSSIMTTHYSNTENYDAWFFWMELESALYNIAGRIFGR